MVSFMSQWNSLGHSQAMPGHDGKGRSCLEGILMPLFPSSLVPIFKYCKENWYFLNIHFTCCCVYGTEDNLQKESELSFYPLGPRGQTQV